MWFINTYSFFSFYFLFNFLAPYVKVYLVKGRKCIAKAKTSIARRTLDPLYQQQLVFHEDYRSCLLQVNEPFRTLFLSFASCFVSPSFSFITFAVVQFFHLHTCTYSPPNHTFHNYHHHHHAISNHTQLAKAVFFISLFLSSSLRSLPLNIYAHLSRSPYGPTMGERRKKYSWEQFKLY